eukprot:CAMPEP_0198110238 /NCGR_PEP_ID=MMETSP1442-20131203/2257_1 /TAXON_ID= /ORGANISM="Craspedostauros australis, Strain CCMP3328" /LENGTH=368 /DNA_ID=CAMNT_0043766203 /DNA_START=195 /DNA_END=1298 /DNA_ORIENTATION=+
MAGSTRQAGIAMAVILAIITNSIDAVEANTFSGARSTSQIKSADAGYLRKLGAFDSARVRSKTQTLSSLMEMRGGQSTDPNNYPNYDEGINYYETQAGYSSPMGAAPAVPDTTTFEPRDTVQDRVEAWRTAQMEKSQSMTQEDTLNPRDEQGRLKLMASLGKGGRALIFFIMMWRDIHFYEIADQVFKGQLRVFAVVPLVFLFLSNLVGVAVSLSSPQHSTKKRLKAILNLNKLLEALLIVWYFLRLTIAPSKYVPRELYIANVIHSVFFLIQCQACTRLNWESAVMKTSGSMMDKTYGSTPSGEDPSAGAARTQPSVSPAMTDPNQYQSQYMQDMNDGMDTSYQNVGWNAQDQSYQQQQQQQQQQYG